jgi:hypothetical protein
MIGFAIHLKAVETEATPELISLCCAGIRWNSDESPPNETKVFSLQPEISLSFGSGTCCNLLEDSVRVSVSGCLAPSKTGFKRGDTGVEYIDDEIDAHDKIIVDLEEVGCTLPPDSTIDVVVYAESNTPTGKVDGAYPWSFETGPAPPSQSGPPPSPPTKPTNPPPKIFYLSPSSGEAGDSIEINGASFKSGSQVTLNYSGINSSYLNPNRLTFTIPTGTGCGTLPVQITNPDTASNIGKFSEVEEFTVICNKTIAPPGRTIINLELDNFFPGGGAPGKSIIINGSGFTRDSKIYFDGNALITEYIFNSQLRFSVPTNAPCGETNVYIKEGLLQSDSKTFTVTEPCGQKTVVDPPTLKPPPEPPPGDDPPPDDSPPPPVLAPPTNADDLQDYDLDNNCKLSDSEFFSATDAWIAEQIDDLLFFAAVDAWIGQLNICSAAAGISTTLRFLPQGILISNSQREPLGLVSIYDTNGQLLYSQVIRSKNLIWKLEDYRGTRIHNGVYIARVGSSGELRKFVVMR